MFSIMTMASSTTKPTEIASAISDRLSIEKPASHMPAQVPASASGTETPAAIVGTIRRRNTNTTDHDQHGGRQQRELHVLDAGADGSGAVDQGRNLDAGRDPLLQFRQQCRERRRRCRSTLASPCLVIWISTAGCLLNQAIERELRTGSSTSATSARPDEIAVRALDDDVAELGRGAHLLVDRERLALAVAVEDADRPERIGVDDGDAGRRRSRSRHWPATTGLSAMRTAGWSAPLTVTSPTPGTCEMRCASTVSATSYIALVEIVFEVSASTNTGAAAGLDLRNSRQRRQVARQVGQRGVDRGLHVARGAVDVAADRELHLDAGRCRASSSR